MQVSVSIDAGGLLFCKKGTFLFNVVVRHLLRKRPQPLRRQLADFVAAAPSPPSPPHEILPVNSHDYTNLLISLSKQTLLPNARHLFDESLLREKTSNTCKILHARLLRLGFCLCGKLGSALVDVYAKCGNVYYSRKVFDCLGERQTAAWNSILSMHSQDGMLGEVLQTFRLMRCSGTVSDQFGLAIVLSAAARLMDISFGKQVHCDVVKTGFEMSSFCESSLIDMYVKCDCIGDARTFFDGIMHPDMISWTSMISGYVRVGMYHEAVDLHRRMEKMGSLLDDILNAIVMTAFLSLRRLEDARALFRRMSSPNAISWNSMISGHAQNGHEVEALCFFREMRSKGVKPTKSTLGSLLSACANLFALDEGQQVHSEAVRFGLDSNVFVGSALANLYAKCSRIEDAEKVFGLLKERNIVMWNAMLGGYLWNGNAEEATRLFIEMQRLAFRPDEFTFVSVFGACVHFENVELGKQLHSVIIKSNFDEDIFVSNAIVDMYAKCGQLSDAKEQFELIHYKDVVSWNAIMVGFVHRKHDEEALGLFHRMVVDGMMPDDTSLASILNACSNIRALEKGKQIHCLSVKHGINSNIYVTSSLVDFYSKLGEVDCAKKVYFWMPERNVVSINALIAGLVQNKKEGEALDMFRQIQNEGISPSELTYASILPACTGPSGLLMGMQVHCHTLKSAILCNNASITVPLFHMYLKFKESEDANKLFLDMPEGRNLILWTAIISGHAQNGYSEDALDFFRKMHSYDIKPDESTFSSVLKACGDLAALEEGRVIHGLILRSGFGNFVHPNSGLVDMYSKCGEVVDSAKVFEGSNKEDIITWNSIIVGFAKNGYTEEALVLFQKMEQSQINPDGITYLGALTACSHAHLVFEGICLFESMTKRYGITPRVEHYACMVDIMGRAGKLKEAEEFIGGLPFKPDGVIWASFLAACRMHGDKVRGERAAEKLIEVEPHSSSPYILLSNMYSASGNWHESRTVRTTMREKGVRKSPGCSWITLGKKTEVFVAGDKFQPNTLEINETLKYLTQEMKDDHLNEVDLLS